MQKYIKVCFPFSHSRCKHIVTDVIEHRYISTVSKDWFELKHI